MEELDLGKKAKELRERALEKKQNELPDITKGRMKEVLSERDAAMQVIYDYQDATGIPTEEEMTQSFFGVEIKQQD